MLTEFSISIFYVEIQSITVCKLFLWLFDYLPHIIRIVFFFKIMV